MAKARRRAATLADYSAECGRELRLGMPVVVRSRQGVLVGVSRRGLVVEFGHGMDSHSEIVRPSDIRFLDEGISDEGED